MKSDFGDEPEDQESDDYEPYDPPPDGWQDGSWQEDARTAHKIAGQGIQMALNMALTMVIFVFGGMWLDRKFETDPWLTVVGAAFGFIAMIYYVIKLADTFGKSGR